MRCPQCKRCLKPWPDAHVGYRGIFCDACQKRWWSDSFRETASLAAQVAVDDAARRLTAILPFPADARDDLDVRRDTEAIVKEWASEMPTPVDRPLPHLIEESSVRDTIIGKKKKEE